METRQLVTLDWKGFLCLNEDNPENCKDYEIRMCCPVDWDCQWEEFGECDMECGGGTKIRKSTCQHADGTAKKTGKLKILIEIIIFHENARRIFHDSLMLR